MYKIKNQKPRILVIGDLMIDHYLWGECNRISPEAPVQVINVKNETKRLGGAGNVLSNLVALDAKVGIMSVIGEDEAGEDIKKLLTSLDISSENLQIDEKRISGQKSRVISSRQQIVRFDKETCEEISSEHEQRLLNRFDDIVKDYDCIVLSDYGKGVLNENICQHIIKKANLSFMPILVDPKGSDYSKYKNASLLTPNKKEAMEATNINISDKDLLLKAIVKLKSDLDLKYSLITLSDEGIAVYDGSLHVIPALSREVFDVTGAGDTVIATLAYALSCKMDILKAVSLANKAAAVVVGKVGSATATFEEIQRYEHEKSIGQLEDRIKTKEELKEILDKSNKKVVFTNGCFDILHIGHAKYLKTAKSFGDILVVGLNSDESTKRLKGEKRPINNQTDRASLLSALGFVDFVVIFDEDTPYNLISYLKPNTLVKGADYKGKKIAGSQIVDDVRLVKFEDGKSTSGIIKRIENAKDDK